jgi:transcriptional regulator with XRE-family HTH domain
MTPYSRVVTWRQIRAEYRRAFLLAKSRGDTQTTIARRGGLIGDSGKVLQNVISNLLRNDRHGPTVEIFVQAVEGLGITVSEFFAAVESGDTQAILDEIAARQPEPRADRLREIERLLRQALATLSEFPRPKPPAPRQ